MPPKRFPKREPAGRKPPPAAASRQHFESNSSQAGPSSISEDPCDHYEEELAWCIHRLKLSLTAKNLTTKQIDDIKKNVSTLENPAESVVKKRCIMKMSLGNYRQQMEKEKNKLPYELRNAVIASAPSSTGQFMRKSHFVADQATVGVTDKTQTSKFSFKPSDNNFRFNFDSVQLE